LIYKKSAVNIEIDINNVFETPMNQLSIYNIIKIFIFLTLLGGAGCHPYIVDVEQGNILNNQNNLSKIHLGLTKDEVQTLLGTPVLVDPFDSNIWLYAHTNQINGGIIKKQKLVLKFKNDKLVSME
jgi:outer membrane protein assembly factor BamE